MEPIENEEMSWLAAVAGDSYAFASIFDRHGDRVYRHARRLTTSAADAEDVTAVVFLELWRRRRAVHVVEGSVLPWLLVTTTNVSRNLTRGLRRYRTMLATLPRSDTEPGAEELAVREIGNEHVALRVHEALGRLKPADAALVALTTFEHYSPAEAAEVLGITAEAARTRLHRARTRMAAVLETAIDDMGPNMTEEGRQ